MALMTRNISRRAPTPNYTVGRYLADRFEEIGLKHYFMVPGDYNLELLDQLLTNENLQQIGCCNELNAAYAAEGYARVNGCGAVITTFNVGAFSALNGVAGAYAENLPVIFVSGSHNTNDFSENRLIHHTIGTHDFSYQYEIFNRVTCAAVRIFNAENAPSYIDQAIVTALRERKPVYIEIACNLFAAPCNKPGPFELNKNTTNQLGLAAAVESAADRINNAKKPLLVAGSHLRSSGAINAFRELAESIGCAVAVMPDAKSFFPEEHPQFIGIYLGGESSDGCEPIFDWADLVLAGGPQFTDYTTEGWTAYSSCEEMIIAGPHSVRFSDLEYTSIELADFFSALAKKVRKNDTTLSEYRRVGRKEERVATQAFDTQPDSPLTRAEMVSQIERELDKQTTLLVETGDSWFNGMYMHLPEGARFEIEMQWGSIGWAVPATFGYALGMEPGRKLVSIIGDGSFQLTAQEVANMIRYKTNNLIILVNNHGYVIESEIHEGPYNYFKNWDYQGIISTFNSEDGNGLGLKATTSYELTSALRKARNHKGGPVLIECQIGHDDCTPQLLKWGTKVAAANSRPLID